MVLLSNFIVFQSEYNCSFLCESQLVTLRSSHPFNYYNSGPKSVRFG